jgi:hypothetical protein
MQTEFRAIVHGEYGAAEDVLRLAECQFKSEELGPDDVLVQVTARPVHPGDIQECGSYRDQIRFGNADPLSWTK